MVFMQVFYLGQTGILEMLVFVEGGEQENPEKNPQSKAKTSNKLNPHIAPGRMKLRPQRWEVL